MARTPTTPPPEGGRRRRWTRWLWRAGLALGALAGLGVLALGAALLWIDSEAGLHFALRRGLTAANGALEGTVEVEDARGHLLSSFTLVGVRVLDPAGAQLLAAEELAVAWSPLALPGRVVHVTGVRVRGLDADLAVGPEGLDLFSILPPRDPDAEPPELPVAIVVEDVGLDGAVSLATEGAEAPFRLEHLALAGALEVRGRRIHPTVHRLAALATEPGLGPVELAADAVLDDGALWDASVRLRRGKDELRASGDVGPTAAPELDLELAVVRLDLDSLRPVAELPLTGVVGLDARVTGPLEAVHTAGTLRLPTGEAGLDATLELDTRPLPYRAAVDLDGVDLGSFLTVADLASSLSGRVTVDGAGLVPGELAGAATVALQASSFREYEVERLRLEGALEPELRARVDRLEVASAMGHADLQGRVAVRDRRLAADGTLEGVDLAWIGDLAGVAGLTGRADGTLTLDGGWGGASGFFAEASGDVGGAGVGVGSVQAARLAATFDGRYGGGGLHGGVQGDAHRLALGGTSAGRATFDLEFVGQGLDGMLQLSVEPEVSARALATVDWSERPLRIHAEELQLETHDAAWQSAQPFTLEIGAGGELTFADLAISGERGSLAVEGTLALSGSSDLSVTARELQLGVLQPVLPAGARALRGVVDLDASLRGRTVAPEGNVQLDGEGVRYGEVGPLAVDVGLVVAGDSTSVVATVGGAELEPLEVQGVVPYRIAQDGIRWERDGMLQLFAELPVQAAGDLAAVLPGAEGLPALDVGLTLSVSGTGARPDARAEVRVRDVAMGELPALAADVDGRLEDERFTVEGRVRDLESQLAEGTIEGSFELGRLLDDTLGGADREPRAYLEDVQLQLGLTGLPVETVRLYGDALDALHGKLVGELSAAELLSDPVVATDLTLRGARLGEVTLTDFSLEGSVEQRQLELALELRTRDGGALSVEASSPIDLSLSGGRSREQRFGQDGLDGTLTGDDLPLGLVTAFIDGTSHSDGTLQLDGSVRGSLLEPDPDLRASVEDGALCHAALGVCYDRIQVQVRSSLRKLVLRRCEADSQPAGDHLTRLQRRQAEEEGAPPPLLPAPPERGGHVEAEGSVVLREGLGMVDLSVDAEDFWLSYTPQLRARANLDLTAKGDYPDVEVRGDVVVQQLDVDMGDELRREAWPLERDPHVAVHREDEREGGEREEGGERPALLDHLDVQVDLELQRDSWIHLDVAAAPGLGRIRPDIQLEGEMALTYRSGQLHGEGEVRAVRGNISVLGKQFEVEEGRVRFTGARPPDPRLDVTAVHHSRHGEIRVRVAGRTSEPELSFGSEEIGADADIVSVLLFGSPVDELRPGESTGGEDALTAVAGMLTTQANQALGRVVGHDLVDLVNIETNPAGPGSYGIEIGKSITERIFLITRYRVGVEEDENQFEGEIELQLARELYLEVRYGDAGNGGLELHFKKRLPAPRGRPPPRAWAAPSSAGSGSCQGIRSD